MASGKGRKRETIRKHVPDPTEEGSPCTGIIPPEAEALPGILDSDRIQLIERNLTKAQDKIKELEAEQSQFKAFMETARGRLGI